MSLFSLWSIQTDTFSFTESQIIILVANTLTGQSYRMRQIINVP